MLYNSIFIILFSSIYTVQKNYGTETKAKISWQRLTLKGWYAAIEDIITIDGDLLHLRSGRDSCMSKNVDLTLVSKILSHISSVHSNVLPTVGLTAALDTKISKPPKSVLVCNVWT